MQEAIFANGCFWCTEAIFKNLKGVISVIPGYTGGNTPKPDYQEVSGGNSGHAEAIKIKFDPRKIKYNDLLNVFFHTHDPTTLNQQGNDIGTQYRSAIFYLDDQQKFEAEDFINELTKSGAYKDPIITEVTKFTKFFPAEDYHKDYYEKNKSQPYCRLIISPKIEKLNKEYQNLLDDSQN